MAAADHNKERIDKDDQAHISTTYEDAYDRAINCAKIEIAKLQVDYRGVTSDVPAKFTADFAKFIKSNIEDINLNTRNAKTMLHAVTGREVENIAPYVEVKYSFKNGDDVNNVVEVMIDYDNKAHDLKKDHMRNIVRLLRIDENGFGRNQQVTENKAVEKLRVELYPHFGWAVSWGKNRKVHRTGHAYISFKTMEMGRSCRPKEGEQGMAALRVKSLVASDNMTGEYVITSFTPKKRRDVQGDVDIEYKKATDALARSLA
ncbi:hypothetical protein Q9L58_008321 [Maublancomyces gigas]|uniref:Uncharacterized protein n=1 Tax=Discina gigas TaxID=1032678 RepID=A0ABR3GA31_9PEZI